MFLWHIMDPGFLLPAGGDTIGMIPTPSAFTPGVILC